MSLSCSHSPRLSNRQTVPDRYPVGLATVVCPFFEPFSGFTWRLAMDSALRSLLEPKIKSAQSWFSAALGERVQLLCSLAHLLPLLRGLACEWPNDRDLLYFLQQNSASCWHRLASCCLRLAGVARYSSQTGIFGSWARTWWEIKCLFTAPSYVRTLAHSHWVNRQGRGKTHPMTNSKGKTDVKQSGEGNWWLAMVA